ncbi:MAG: Uma2 family endonuclease [Candidatus Rokubacteria bacterium]|nr:Uma2 family endonuclease [Candidatus Rokubacteria bacterium]
MGTRVILTYRDYEALPADGRRYELHEGELSVTPAPGTQHQRVVGRLYRLLCQHAEAHRLGEVFVSPVDCILSDTTVVQPDIVYVESARSPLVSARGIEGPPTLVVEVLSPSTAQLDRGTKLQLYARYRVPYYWIVELEGQCIEAYALAEGTFKLAGRLDRGESGSLPPFPDLTTVATSLSP